MLEDLLMQEILRTKDIVKKYDNLVANDQVSISLNKGELIALLGENGSGKSTFLNVLYGLWQPDEGEIYINGEKVTINSPSKAILEYKIGKVSQHSDLVPSFTVGENILYKKIPRKCFLFTDNDHIKKKVTELIEVIDSKLDPKVIIEDLSVGEQQQVELLKVLAQDAEILLLDEITAFLAPKEVDEFFILINRLKKIGHSIIFVTHKISEAMRCDKIVVLRKGKVVLFVDKNDTEPSELVKAMFLKEFDYEYSKASSKNNNNDNILEVRDVSTIKGNANKKYRSDLQDVSFSLRRGEILGIAGVVGNGQSELLDIITGSRMPTRGIVFINGENIVGRGGLHYLRKNNLLAYIPEDRNKVGSFGSLCISDNMVLGECRKEFFFPQYISNFKRINEFTNNLIEEYQIKVSGLLSRADSLSGGNRQKVILARELSLAVDLVIAAQPTRGLDYKTAIFVHKKLLEKKENGKAVLLISSDLDEILALSDRVAVMYEGNLTVVPEAEMNLNDIGRRMVGFDEYQNNEII